jgi:hypothetical protein
MRIRPNRVPEPGVQIIVVSPVEGQVAWSSTASRERIALVDRIAVVGEADGNADSPRHHLRRAAVVRQVRVVGVTGGDAEPPEQGAGTGCLDHHRFSM